MTGDDLDMIDSWLSAVIGEFETRAVEFDDDRELMARLWKEFEEG